MLGLFLVLAVSAIGLQGSTAALERGSAARPHIAQDPIPFPARRKLQTRRYARRHYGLDTFRLARPKVIVQHFTGSTSFQSAYNTFASNQPDIELHELPGLCAHFIVGRDGTIHQLVSLSLMCRHTIGLNWTAVGIEHVGVSDRDILGNRRQLAASLRLTRWLQDRLGIRTRNVIGHAESLSSPYHHERISALAHRTHGDFRRATMRRYRRLLERGADASATRARVVLGRSVRGRMIDAVRSGDAGAPRKVLVFGSIHGNETAGSAIARRLERRPPPRGAELWVVRDINPDGTARRTRQNARGVDLNRNFPRRWRQIGGPGHPEYSGRGPLSEPETRIARRLIRQLRPAITIWFHQPLALVDRSGGDPGDMPYPAAVRRAQRPAATADTAAPRHRDALAEPRLPRHDRIRGRAAARKARPRAPRALHRGCADGGGRRHARYCAAMSDDAAVRIVRDAYEAWNRDGPQALGPWVADELELRDPPEMPDARVWVGRDAVLARLEDVAAAVGGRWVELRGIRLAGDEVVVSMSWQVDDSRDSAVLGDVFHRVRVTNGKIDRMRVFLSEEAAR